MGTIPQLALGTDAERYEALLRISEALSVCREPEEVSRVLTDRLRELIRFDFIDVLIFKENSNQIEWHLIGAGTSYRDIPIEETSTWHVYQTQEPVYIEDWNADTRFPALRRVAEKYGLQVGSVVRVPLTTAYRRLGTLGVASHSANAYRSEDLTFLEFVGREVALALDNALNLKKSEAARLELERQNARLKLLLDLTNRINCNLDLRELLRAVSANVRELMRCDAVGVALRD